MSASAESGLRLAWTEPSPPNKEYGYHHVSAETPFGRLFISWRGWKEFPLATVDEPSWACDGGWFDSPEEAQRHAEATYRRTLAEALAALEEPPAKPEAAMPSAEACGRCRGEGYIWKIRSSAYLSPNVICPACNGTGQSNATGVS